MSTPRNGKTERPAEAIHLAMSGETLQRENIELRSRIDALEAFAKRMAPLVTLADEKRQEAELRESLRQEQIKHNARLKALEEKEAAMVRTSAEKHERVTIRLGPRSIARNVSALTTPNFRIEAVGERVLTRQVWLRLLETDPHMAGYVAQGDVEAVPIGIEQNARIEAEWLRRHGVMTERDRSAHEWEWFTKGWS